MFLITFILKILYTSNVGLTILFNNAFSKEKIPFFRNCYCQQQLQASTADGWIRILILGLRAEFSTTSGLQFQLRFECSNRLSYTCGLYYKNIFMIVSDDHKWCLYYKMCFTLAVAYALALASVITYDRKWRFNLECHLLMTLAVSITIVICL